MSEDVQRVEVITSVQHRRRWSVAEKVRLVEQTLEPGISVSFVAGALNGELAIVGVKLSNFRFA